MKYLSLQVIAMCSIIPTWLRQLPYYYGQFMVLSYRLSQMAGGRIQCKLQRLSVFLACSIRLSWDYLRLQDCVAGDCNHSGIQHQES